jgi:hypothetical protein
VLEPFTKYPTGNKVATFSVQGKTKWLNNNELIYQEAQQVNPPRPWENGYGIGLSKIRATDGKKQILLQADKLNDYQLLKVENEIIYFSKRTVASSDDWEVQEKQIETYWKINTDGTNMTEINKPETLENEVLALIPQQYSNYQLYSLDRNDKLTNWVVFELSEGGSIYNDLICILDIENPATSFRQITVGTSPNW